MPPIQNPYLRNHLSLAGPWHIIIDPYETGARNMFGEPNPYGYHLNQNPQTRCAQTPTTRGCVLA